MLGVLRLFCIAHTQNEILTWVFTFWATAAAHFAFVVGDVAHCGFGPRAMGWDGARARLCQTKLFVDVDEEGKKGKKRKWTARC